MTSLPVTASSPTTATTVPTALQPLLERVGLSHVAGVLPAWLDRAVREDLPYAWPQPGLPPGPVRGGGDGPRPGHHPVPIARSRLPLRGHDRPEGPRSSTFAFAPCGLRRQPHRSRAALLT
jgi:hypothetical protein